MSTTTQIQFTVDADDERSIHEAITRRQSWRINGVPIMPDGDSDLRGALIAEICRGWIEFMDAAETKGGES